MEVRYIVLTGEESRRAIISFVARHYFIHQEDVVGIEITGPDEAPSAVVRLKAKTINIEGPDLGRVLLLFCKDHHIPVPQRAQKKIQYAAGGLKLVMTTDITDAWVPRVVDDRITYGETAREQEFDELRQKIADATARAEQAERKAAAAEAKVTAAERACAELVAAQPQAGLLGRIGRLLNNR